MSVASPYALFRAADRPWSCSATAPAPSRARKRLLPAAVIQGELFALQPALPLQPNVLPFQPQSRPAPTSKPM
ncbi:MAG: hypothetical protein VKI83_01315 [Synechococcaceae cyanobacterium]|nr:hypothetical protein [Synechococcaceae cyanobacterium]